MSPDLENLDRRIMELLVERTALYLEELRKREGSDEYPEDRARLWKLIEERDLAPLGAEAVKKLYTEILSYSMKALRPLRVAFLGPEATFSNIALNEFFGEAVSILPQKTVSDVFREVEVEGADYGVVPIENSTEGAVTMTMDELLETGLLIVSEKYLRITLTLLSNEEDIGRITKIYSHLQPLGQCRAWLRANVPNAAIQSVDSTSRAAELASREPGTAAVASEMAARVFSLKALASHIEDSSQNSTRFFIMGRKEAPPTGADKTSIVCAVKDRPGALLKLLTPFSEAGINMTRIESRPDKKKTWEYNFFIDILGHKDDAVAVKCLNASTGNDISDNTRFVSGGKLMRRRRAP